MGDFACCKVTPSTLVRWAPLLLKIDPETDVTVAVPNPALRVPMVMLPTALTVMLLLAMRLPSAATAILELAPGAASTGSLDGVVPALSVMDELVPVTWIVSVGLRNTIDPSVAVSTRESGIVRVPPRLAMTMDEAL